MILWVPIIYFFYTANNKEAVKLTDYNINRGIQYKIPMSYAIVVWSQIDWDGKRPGFDIFNLFFKCFISQDFHWWLMFIAIVSGLCLMSVLRRYSVDFFYSSFLFMAMQTFVWMLNGMRQFICVSILFACCNWIKEGRIVKFIIVVLGAGYIDGVLREKYIDCKTLFDFAFVFTPLTSTPALDLARAFNETVYLSPYIESDK